MPPKPHKSLNAARSSAAAGGGASSSKLSAATVVMWLLNGALLAATVFTLSNWTAINWATGSYGWAAVLEIGALLLIAFQAIVGGCVMGFASRVDASFVHLQDSPQLLYLFAAAMPFLIATFFGSLAFMSLVNIKATNLFVASHAEAVFKQASLYAADGAKGINFLAFEFHICALPSFLTKCDWLIRSGSGPHWSFVEKAGVDLSQYPLRQDLFSIFDAMLAIRRPADDLLTVEDFFVGVQRALAPYKQRFGFAVLAITVVCVLQFSWWWIKWTQYQKTHKSSKAAEKETRPFIGP